jgi:hypothetical protein
MLFIDNQESFYIIGSKCIEFFIKKCNFWWYSQIYYKLKEHKRIFKIQNIQGHEVYVFIKFRHLYMDSNFSKYYFDTIGFSTCTTKG